MRGARRTLGGGAGWGWLLALALALGSPSSTRAGLVGLPSGFVDELVVGGLPFPTAVAFTPEGRMLVALKHGEVLLYEGTTLLGTFMQLSDRVHDNHDRGLLSVAPHPDFPATPYVYLLYTYDPPGVHPDAVRPNAPPPTSVPARVARLTRVEADPATGYTTAKAGTEVVLLGSNSTRANIGDENDGRNTAIASCMSPQTYAGTPVEDCIPSDEDSHTIGTVVFAPDGSLFVSSGDGSNYVSSDPRALRSQHLDSLAGKVLRIDPITGLGLPDNPFYVAGQPNRNRSKVWAYGLRNPFRIALHPATGEPYIGDVGWNSWEEIDTGKGANFGWPCYEGGAVSGEESGVTTSLEQPSYLWWTPETVPFCQALVAQGLGAVKAPVFSYFHGLAGNASANAGAFYAGSTYPAAYQGALFIADYGRDWIRYLTFDAQGNATVHPFGVTAEAYAPPVQVIVGPDSNLYWMQYSGEGGAVRRIRYTGAGNTPPVVMIEADPTVGLTPLTVSFDSNASYDPDAQPLAYAWDFGDGATSNERNPSHTYLTAGTYDATLTLTEQSPPGASNSESVRITVGNNPPLAAILTPADGASYRVGDVILFSGTATSGSNPVPATQQSWELRTVHDQHFHYDTLPSAASPGDPNVSLGSFTVADHGDNVRFQLCLTALVLPENLTDTQCIDLFPQKTEISVGSDPIGLLIGYVDEGVALPTPALIYPVVNSVQTIAAFAVQQHRSFVGWADGPTTLARTFTVGTTPLSFTALYQNLPPTAVLAPASASGSAPLTVAFSATASSDPEGDVLQYAWDAGAAGSSTDPAPSFTFTTPGQHTVSLTVTDQLGATDDATASVGAAVPGAPACSDAIDNDGDGASDYPDDPGCFQGYSASEAPQCDDGLDNDGDGKRDWDGAGVGEADLQCSAAWRTNEAARSCGLGFELVFLLPLALRLRRRRR
jgi:glucose/arabinose dehydrogenase/chitodextrinase